MHTIYFIPGLGADERLFSRLKLEGYDKKCIHWEVPGPKETLPEYARRLSAQVDTKGKFSLIGASFGGMVAVEMSKIIRPENLVLISSIKTFREMPWFVRFFRTFQVYHLMSESFLQWLATLNVHRFGIYSDEEKKLFSDMLYACPAGYLKGALDMMMHWHSPEVPVNILRIHGENDRLFPVGNIQSPLVIKGGTHFMPYHKAEEIEKILRERLK